MMSLVMTALLASTAAAEDKDDNKSKKQLSLSPIIAASSWTPPNGGTAEVNLALGGRLGYDIVPRKALGLAVSAGASYIGIVGLGEDARMGREWRGGLLLGPRLGSKPGKVTELSATFLVGLDVLNDTYRFPSLGDNARVSQATLLNVPFKVRAVAALVDAELGIAPSFFIDDQAGDAITPRAPAEGLGLGDELEWTAGVGVRLGSAFRLGVNLRTRETGYGTLRYFGFGFGVGT